ncbi:MAG: hypothetical protein K1X61_01630 [Chitinophagales bacterium]|nr:hypothetical protein [Chitinophagales bacterium]
MNNLGNKYNYAAAIVNLLITAFGVLILQWSVQPVIYLFWMEIIIIVIVACIRMMGAMDGKPFIQTLPGKIPLLIAALFTGAMIISLAVAFTIGVFANGTDSESFKGIGIAVAILWCNYLSGLIIQFFLSGHFRVAVPFTELIFSFVYLLILLAFIMAVTQHLIPALSSRQSPTLTGLSVIGIKFIIDCLRAYLTPYVTPGSEESPSP